MFNKFVPVDVVRYVNSNSDRDFVFNLETDFGSFDVPTFDVSIRAYGKLRDFMFIGQIPCDMWDKSSLNEDRMDIDQTIKNVNKFFMLVEKWKQEVDG